MVQTVAFKKYCGKKAVVRNNVRRRLKAAARLVFPAHAARGELSSSARRQAVHHSVPPQRNRPSAHARVCHVCRCGCMAFAHVASSQHRSDHMYLVSARALAVLAPNEALVHEMAGCLQQLRLYSNHDLLGAGVTALGSVPLVDGRAAHATSLTDAVARGTDDSDGDGDDLGYSTDGDFDFSDYGDDDW